MHWDRTRITTRSSDDYPILGFDELLRTLDMQLIEHPGQPALDAGEGAAGPTAAAIANALQDAIRVGVRDLSFKPEAGGTFLWRRIRGDSFL